MMVLVRLALLVGVPVSTGFYIVDAVSKVLRLPFLM